LLFFTSSPVEDGARKLFHPKTRLRLTDGCILLGQQMDSDDLVRLVDEGFPFVAVGRRDEADVPFVGIDYRHLTSKVVEKAVALGHQNAIYAHHGRRSPSADDRLAALQRTAGSTNLRTTFLNVAEVDLAEVAATIAAGTDTVVFAEDVFIAEALALDLAERGTVIPDDVSLVVLGEVEGHSVSTLTQPHQAGPAGRRQLTGFRLPRERLAREALALLQELIVREPKARARLRMRTLLGGSVVAGETLAGAGGTR
jgi:DNA-binding LacI/PurR family transcriptional regulator